MFVEGVGICAFLNSSLSFYGFRIEQPWEPITNAVQTFTHSWRSRAKHPSLVHSNVQASIGSKEPPLYL